jgi:fibronectin type III domain protein
MRKAERGFGSGRLVGAAIVGSLAIALAGCGDDDSGASGLGATGTSPPTTVADTASGSPTTGGGSSTTAPPASTPASSSAVTLAWEAPTENSNGTPITGLAGYKIHYGTAPQEYTQVVSVSNPSLSRYVLDSLPSGTYYFAITAYNSQGMESALSGEITAKL